MPWDSANTHHCQPTHYHNPHPLPLVPATPITVNPPTMVDGSGGWQQWGDSMVVCGGWCQLMAPVGGGDGL